MEEVGGDGGYGGDGEAADALVEVILEMEEGVVVFAENAFGAREECFAGIGEGDAAGESVEKGVVEGCFEAGDLLGDGGLRDAAACGGLGDGAGFGGGDEVPELLDVHRHFLWYASSFDVGGLWGEVVMFGVAGGMGSVSGRIFGCFSGRAFPGGLFRGRGVWRPMRSGVIKLRFEGAQR